MTEEKVENVVGALALALADDLVRAAQRHAPSSAPAAAISLLGHAPGLTIRQVSRVLGLSHPGAVRLVDRLVGDDLVRRDRSADDGRAVALTLTPNGEAVCRQVLASRRGALARALSSLDAAERQTLGRMAEAMLRGLVGGEDHALRVCRLCDPGVCRECPVEAEMTAREGPT